ncbi:MAG: CerR family C-terminal domain-containing protein [Candidatus Andeanibacterium colombiense]|uniref:CerR family C-terminal domain-containing protein n=1 Tax=Candidatus Andeanibacterium colombiense TaxID=3121345 RepID=A0AAJ5XBM9_9SPHN|nr:MAG: CerR family C-terminal domain-containing protein [Sphingomonadaceae bacterium]
MSSITYHFGGKEGLYLACADYIAQQASAQNAAGFALMQDIGVIDRATAIERCLAILDGFALTMLHPASESWSRFIVREQQAPTEAFDRLYRGMMKAPLEGFGHLLAIVRPDLPARERRAAIILLFGQALILRAGRASVCKALGIDNLGEKEARLLRSQLRANSLCILNGGSA